MDSSLLLEGGLGATATLAIVEAFKRARMNTRYAPLCSLIVGMLLSILVGLGLHSDLVTILVMGFGFGGVASHGYSIAKKM